MNNIEELETVTLTISLEHKSGRQDIPLRVTITPPKDENIDPASAVRVSINGKHSGFLLAIISEVLPSVVETLEESVKENGDPLKLCDCPKCEARRKRGGAAVIEPEGYTIQ